MDTIHVSDLKAIAERARVLVDEAIDEIIVAIDTKILVGNIHVPAEKKPRKKRTRKVRVPEFPPPKGEPSLPDADKNSTFYGKKKEKKGDVGES